MTYSFGNTYFPLEYSPDGKPSSYFESYKQQNGITPSILSVAMTAYIPLFRDDAKQHNQMAYLVTSRQFLHSSLVPHLMMAVSPFEFFGACHPMTTPNCPKKLQFLAENSSTAQFVKNLNFGWVTWGDLFSNLRTLVSKWPYFTRTVASVKSQFTTQDEYFDIIGKIPSLKEVDLSDLYLSEDSFGIAPFKRWFEKLENLPQLESLILRDARGTVRVSLLNNNNNTNSSNVVDPTISLEYIPHRIRKTLRKLDFSNIGLFHPAVNGSQNDIVRPVASLKEFTNLRELHLGNVLFDAAEENPDIVEECLSPLIELRVLSIAALPEKANRAAVFEGLINMECLYLPSVPDNNDIARSFGGMKNLRKLRFLDSQCPATPIDVIIEISKQSFAKNLQTLQFSCIPNGSPMSRRSDDDEASFDQHKKIFRPQHGEALGTLTNLEELDLQLVVSDSNEIIKKEEQTGEEVVVGGADCLFEGIAKLSKLKFLSLCLSVSSHHGLEVNNNDIGEEENDDQNENDEDDGGEECFPQGALCSLKAMTTFCEGLGSSGNLKALILETVCFGERTRTDTNKKEVIESEVIPQSRKECFVNQLSKLKSVEMMCLRGCGPIHFEDVLHGCKSLHQLRTLELDVTMRYEYGRKEEIFEKFLKEVPALKWIKALRIHPDCYEYGGDSDNF